MRRLLMAPLFSNKQYDYLGSTNQQWNIIPQGDGSYEIRNVYSGKVLDVTGVSTANGAIIQQWDWLNGLNQKWQIIQTAHQDTCCGGGDGVDVFNLSANVSGNTVTITGGLDINAAPVYVTCGTMSVSMLHAVSWNIGSWYTTDFGPDGPGSQVQLTQTHAGTNATCDPLHTGYDASIYSFQLIFTDTRPGTHTVEIAIGWAPNGIAADPSFGNGIRYADVSYAIP